MPTSAIIAFINPQLCSTFRKTFIRCHKSLPFVGIHDFLSRFTSTRSKEIHVTHSITATNCDDSQLYVVRLYLVCGVSCRSRRLAALTSSPRRSSASALSGSALRITFSRYALSEKAGRSALQNCCFRKQSHVNKSK